jgi:hypothetical protein
MIETFVLMMVGHFVGDYLLQNQWMATRKSLPGKAGHYACTIHVTLYTLAVSLIASIYNPWALLSIFLPHWVIDRWSIAKYLLRFKNGYTLHEVWEKAPLCAAPAPGQLEQNVWKVAFAAPVYIMNDNTLHFLCLLLTAKYLR